MIPSIAHNFTHSACEEDSTLSFSLSSFLSNELASFSSFFTQVARLKDKSYFWSWERQLLLVTLITPQLSPVSWREDMNQWKPLSTCCFTLDRMEARVFSFLSSLFSFPLSLSLSLYQSTSHTAKYNWWVEQRLVYSGSNLDTKLTLFSVQCSLSFSLALSLTKVKFVRW